MIRKYVLPLLAVVGIVFALWMVKQSAKPVIPAEAVAEPPRVVFANKISGVGIVEASMRNVSIGSSIAGIVQRVHVRVGQRIRAGDPLIRLENLSRLHVRVDIDENDAWRFSPDASAVAFVRKNPSLKTDLRFEYIERYVVPKRSLTGDSTERVDTRVMQAVYSFDRRSLDDLPGQLMDVFIEDRSAQR